MIQTARNLLRNLHDDCQERARRSRNGDARSVYQRIATDACHAMRMPGLGEDGLRKALAAVVAQAEFAAYVNGDLLPVSATTAVEHPQGIGAFASPATAQLKPDDSPVPPPDALNARQLAELLSMNERTARRWIELGVRNGLPGFYREGCHWYAKRDAFKLLRCYKAA